MIIINNWCNKLTNSYSVLSLLRFIATPFYRYSVLSLLRFIVTPFYRYSVLSLLRFIVTPFYPLLKRYIKTYYKFILVNMNIVKTIKQYNKDFVYFCEPIKNNIMNNGQFIRIIYSTPLFILNGIYIIFNLNHMTIEKYYNKFKCTFDIHQHKEMIDSLKTIEEDLLQKINIYGKMPQYKIYEQLKNGNIKIFSDTFEKTNNTFLLKIAGIWETETEYGLTYKFINV